ncbi:MAG: dihydrofolate reductase [Phycisphaerales bacterium]|nr:dihydrofolate reductase [Planctomycetota bacterium]MCH8507369.1 dihydrofolate reductase [Phycisphaerales bacterium]
MPSIVLIAAASENNIIGRDGGLPWRLPDDLRHFKRETLGRPVVMGRKTFDELFQEPLKGRPNIIISRTMPPRPPTEGVIVARSLDEAIELAKPLLAAARAADPSIPDEICIIGGGEIYRQALPIATHITLTRVHAQVEGDTTFPDFDRAEWTLDRHEHHEADARHAHPFTIEWWSR